MKKIFILIIIILTIVMAIKNNNKDYGLSSDSIRFRVIANSNDINDILIKEKVANEIIKLVIVDGNKENVKENILNNIELIKNKIDDIFKNNNYDKSYNIIYGENKFPEKKIKDVTFKEGYYESLVIEIGEGKGNNYWCFLYPSLCVSNLDDYEKDKYSFAILKYLKNIFE